VKIDKGIFVASFAMTQMLETVKSEFCSMKASKKYPFSVPLVSDRNILLTNSSIKQVELASTMKDAAPSGSKKQYQTVTMIDSQTVHIICHRMFVWVFRRFVIRSRCRVVDGDNSVMEYEMTILCLCVPIAVRHEWNWTKSILCH
jgi:hypothetical protein